MRPRRDERFAVRLTRAEKQELERVALEQDRTAASVLRQAVKLLLAKQGEKAR